MVGGQAGGWVGVVEMALSRELLQQAAEQRGLWCLQSEEHEIEQLI